MEEQNQDALPVKKKYLFRDVSWLHFNYRVLQEAKDPTVPLYERIKFLAIYSSNLDEFFRVRVASLRSFKKLRKETRRELKLKPTRTLKEIRRLVKKQQNEFGKIFRSQIIPQLKENGVQLIRAEEFLPVHQSFAKHFFDDKPKVLSHPMEITEKEEQPFLENKALYFVVEVPGKLYVVKIPSDHCDRFVVLPADNGQQYVTFLDDIIRFHIPEILPGEEIKGIYAIKISRDAELYIDDEFSGDLIKKIKKGLADRDLGLPTRLLYDASMPKEVVKRLKSIFNLSKYDLIPGARYHNFNDFFGFPDPTNNPDLHNPPMPPLDHPELSKVDAIMKAIEEKDHILHFPYQKFDYLLRFMEEAIADEQVEEIKITLYRVADNSMVGDYLLKALEAGKKVTVFIEAKARFDEASNLKWGDRLEAAGAVVMYSYPGIKVHTKLLLVRKRVGESYRNYVYIGTGNFNEKTAKLYCDHALLTADPRLADEIEQVFRLLEDRQETQCEHILVASKPMRNAFKAMIEKEINNAKNGQEAYMILKMNSLEDREMMDLLYKASKAGVKITLIVRGICCIVPGDEEFSRHISGKSIVDRFLEHARVYIFANGGEEKMYIASADWMTRNLHRRIEVAAPIYDPDIYKQIRDIIDLQLKDNTKARSLNAGKLNKYEKNLKQDNKDYRAQTDTYSYLENLLD